MRRGRVLRALTGIDEAEQSITFAGNVPQGVYRAKRDGKHRTVTFDVEMRADLRQNSIEADALSKRVQKPGNPKPPDLAEDYIALAHNEGMNLLQSHAAKSRKTAAWKTGFPAQIRAYSHPPKPGWGMEKVTSVHLTYIKMNNIRIHSRYLSVNSTTPFLPFFGQKWALFARKLPIFGLKNAASMIDKAESLLPPRCLAHTGL
jgi:hypothetical protein